MREELEFATRVAREAGAVTLEYFQTGVKTSWKADASPVTVADLEAEQLIRSRIRERYPDDGIVGEEEGDRPGRSGRTWLIDPIDGTNSFVQGVPLYAVLIALEERDAATVGVVYLPALDEMVCAARGEGCFWNDRVARVSDVDVLEKSCLVYTSGSLFAEFWPQGDAIRGRLESASRVMRSWGDAYGYVLVATGRAEGMLDPIVNPWDIAPVVPILEEAGGRFTDWRGSRGSRVSSGLASNGVLHEELLRLIGVGGAQAGDR